MKPFLLRREELIVTGILLLTFAYFYQGGGWNQNARLDLTRSVAELGTFSIDCYVYNTGDWSEWRGHRYAAKAPGLSIAAVPLYVLVRTVAGIRGISAASPSFLRLFLYLATVATVALPSALMGVLFYRLLSHIAPGDRRWALWVALFLLLGTIALPYSTLWYGHQTAAALSFLSLYLIATRCARPLWCILAGAAAGLAGAVEYPALAGAVLLAAYAAWRCRRAAWLFACGAAPFLLLLGAYHWSCFGSPFTTPYAVQNPVFMGGSRGVSGLQGPGFSVIAALLFSPRRGLLVYSPFLLAAIPGFARMLKKRENRAIAALCGGMCLLYLLINGAWPQWTGGWSIGPRHLTGLLPFLAVPIVFCHRSLREGVTLLAVPSIVLMLLATAVGPEVPTEHRSPFWDHVVPQAARGEFSLSTQGPGDYLPKGAGTAGEAFNMGHRLGLGAWWSLAPLLAVWVVGGILLLRLPPDSNPEEFPAV